MSFRWKTALCMVCLVSLLFGAGSCALISLSFQTALAREEAAARASYDLLFRTLQMVESVEVWSGPQDAAQAIAQLSAQGNQSWAALSLESDQKTFLTQGTIPEGFLDLSGLVDPSHYAQSAFSYQGRHYLQLSGQLEVQGEPLLLNVAYATSPPSTRPGSNSSRPMGGFFSFCLPSVQGSPMPLPGSSPGRWTSSPTRPSSWRPETCPAGRESPRPMRSAPWPGSLTPWPPGRRSTSPPCRPPWRGRTGSSAALPTS